MNKQFIFCLILISSLFILASQAFSRSESLVFLEPAPELNQSSFFQKLLEMDKADRYFEKTKIDYLLSRVKQSRYQFIRNDEYFTAHRAAIHLKWKFLRNRSRVKTAEDFVAIVAGHSKMSGKPYLVITEEKGIYRLREVLENELEYLEKNLYRAREKAEIKETGELAEVPLDAYE